MAKQPMIARQIRVPASIWEAAKEIAEQNDETISDVVRRAITKYVRKHRGDQA